MQALFSRESGPLSDQQRRSLTNVGRMVIGLVVIVGGVVFIRYLRRRKQKQRTDGRANLYAGDPPPPTPWYDRFLQLAAARIGRRRAHPATHREYAGEVATAGDDLSPLAGPATEEYYRVRFGRKLADPATLTQLAADLDRVEAAETAS